MQFSVQDLISSLGRSISAAQQTIENHALQRFFDFFEADMHHGKDGEDALSYRPKTVTVSLPSVNDLTKYCDVDIPLPALAHHRQVHLDRVTVNVRTKLVPGDGGEMMADMEAPEPNDANRAKTPSDDVFGELNLVFQVGETAEGVARVVQNITKTI